jgi:hypothetical protein
VISSKGIVFSSASTPFAGIIDAIRANIIESAMFKLCRISFILHSEYYYAVRCICGASAACCISPAYAAIGAVNLRKPIMLDF